MTGTVIPFPVVTIAQTHRDQLSALDPGRNALVIQHDGDGQYAVRLAPAINLPEQCVEMHFPDGPAARIYAMRTQRICPVLYQMVVDQTPFAEF